jgi:hypothetical protein
LIRSSCGVVEHSLIYRARLRNREPKAARA